MAKTGKVVPESGADAAIAAAVLQVTPAIMSLGQIASNALSGSDSPELLVVDLGTRKVSAFLTSKANTVSTAIQAASDKIERMVPDDDTKRVSSWTSTPGIDPTGAVANDTAKAQRSLASLISAIEDAYSAGSYPGPLSIVVDQVAGNITVFSTTAANTHIGSTAPDAVIDQTVATPSGNVKNAFE
jgi:hypothetical protein